VAVHRTGVRRPTGRRPRLIGPLLAADDQAKLELGLDVLDYIAGSNITTAEQAQFIRIAAERIVGQRLGLDAEDARGDQ